MAKPFTHSRVRSNNKTDILSDISTFTKPLHRTHILYVQSLYSVCSILRKLYSLSAIRQSKNKEDEKKIVGVARARCPRGSFLFFLVLLSKVCFLERRPYVRMYKIYART